MRLLKWLLAALESLLFPLLAMGILAVVMYIMMKFAKLNGFDNYKDITNTTSLGFCRAHAARPTARK